MNCQQVAALGALGTVELLPDSKRDPLEKHLAGCAECRRQSEALSDAYALMCEPETPFDKEARWSELLPQLNEARMLHAEVKAVAKGGGVRIALACVYCRGELEREQAVYCASCLSPHHGECFQTHKTCAAPGCGEALAVRPERVQATRQRSRRAAAWIGAAAVAVAASAATVAIERRSEPPIAPRHLLAQSPPIQSPSISPDPAPGAEPSAAVREAATALFAEACEYWRAGALGQARPSLELIARALPGHPGARRMLAGLEEFPGAVIAPHPSTRSDSARYERRREQFIERMRWAEFLLTEDREAKAIEELKATATGIGQARPYAIYLADLEAQSLMRLADFGWLRGQDGAWTQGGFAAAPPADPRAQDEVLKRLFEARLNLAEAEAELRIEAQRKELEDRLSKAVADRRRREKLSKIELARLASQRGEDNDYIERLLEREGLSERCLSPRQLRELAEALEQRYVSLEERREAARRLAMADLGPRWIAEAMARAAVEDPDLPVRLSCLEGLERFGLEAAAQLPRLLKAGAEAPESVADAGLGRAYEAAWLKAIGALGRDSGEARARVIRALNSEGTAARRRAALEALETMALAQAERLKSLDQVDERVTKRLERAVIDLGCEDMPFSDVVEFLSDISGLKFELTGRVRTRLFVEKPRVNLKLKSISLGNAVKLLVDHVKGLAYVARDGRVILCMDPESPELLRGAREACEAVLTEAERAFAGSFKNDPEIAERASAALEALARAKKSD